MSVLTLKINGQILIDTPPAERREVVVHDELTGTFTSFYLKEKQWYIKNGEKYKKIHNIGEYTGRIYLKNKEEKIEKAFNVVVDIFLKDVFNDFQRIKTLIDREMIPIKYAEKKLWIANIPENDHYRVLKGYMQSRKTWAIIAISLYYLLRYKMSMFIIVQNSVDACDQLLSRFSQVYSRFVDYIESLGNFKHYFQQPSVVHKKAKNIKNIDEAMFDKPKIFVVLRNKTDVLYVNSQLEKATIKRFALFIDESDFNDSGSLGGVQKALNILKSNSSVVYDITATPMTSLMKEKIDAGNIIMMEPPSGYKGILDLQFMKLEKDAYYCSATSDDPFVQDKNLKKYLKDFSRTEPYEINGPWGKQLHPRYSLIRIGAPITPQIIIANYIFQKYRDKIVVITYNGGGSGITMRGDKLPQKNFYIGNCESNFENNAHTFKKNIHIGEIIAFLQKKGVNKFPRIVVLAGKMADRGITFATASYSECMEKKIYPWHLTEMYFVVAKSMSQANLLQAVGRLCGIFPDNIPLHLYTNVTEDIIKAYGVQEELIERAKKARNEKEYFRDIIESQPISRSKCTKRRITSPKVPCHLQKVEDDFIHGGYDWYKMQMIPDSQPANFGNGTRISQERKILSQEELDKIKRETDEKRKILKEEIKEIDPKEFARLCDMLKKWSIAETKIAKFMANLDPDKAYKKSEIEADCHEFGVRLTDLHAKPDQKRVKYGNIIQFHEGRYRLYPCLVTPYKKYYNYEGF